jgi:hypothetical protein
VYATVIAKGVTDFANNCEQLKYGLHWDAVTSRWARELANEVGSLDVTKKATYANISQFFNLFCSNSPRKVTTFSSFFQISGNIFLSKPPKVVQNKIISDS